MFVCTLRYICNPVLNVQLCMLWPASNCFRRHLWRKLWGRSINQARFSLAAQCICYTFPKNMKNLRCTLGACARRWDLLFHNRSQLFNHTQMAGWIINLQYDTIGHSQTLNNIKQTKSGITFLDFFGGSDYVALPNSSWRYLVG